MACDLTPPWQEAPRDGSHWSLLCRVEHPLEKPQTWGSAFKEGEDGDLFTPEGDDNDSSTRGELPDWVTLFHSMTPLPFNPIPWRLFLTILFSTVGGTFHSPGSQRPLRPTQAFKPSPKTLHPSPQPEWPHWKEAAESSVIGSTCTAGHIPQSELSRADQEKPSVYSSSFLPLAFPWSG